MCSSDLWGPQYLHSTGQFHKGGRPAGAFLYLVADPAASPTLEIPEAGFSFAQMQLAQAQGDGAVLSDLGRPVQTLLLRDRAADIDRLLALLEGLPDAPARLPDPESEMAPESEPEPGSEPDAESQPESESEQDLASEAEQDTESQSGSQPESEEPLAEDPPTEDEPSAETVDGGELENTDTATSASATDDSRS